MTLGPLPTVDTSKCTGCGDCVPLCPTGCLQMRGVLPWLPRPEDCISCGVCVLICPDAAIEWEVHPRPGEHSPRQSVCTRKPIGG